MLNDINSQLNEIVRVTCRNRKKNQIDRYGKALNDLQIQSIIDKSIRNYRKDMSVDEIVKLMSLEVYWEESNLERSIPKMIAEYGM